MVKTFEKFKLRAVDMYEQGGMGYRAIDKELGIPSKTQVLQLVRKKNSGQGFNRSEREELF